MLKLTEGTQKTERPEPKITFIQKVIKNETWMVMAQSAVELEDEFSSLYYTAGQQNNLFLQPPFEPNVLLSLVQTNNVLNQCIEAMEVNIDSTGHEFVPTEEGKDIDKSEEKIAQSFFDEPYPNTSMTEIRRKLRRQMESIGYGFIEVLRNVAGDVVGMRSVETAHIRMVKLDKPIQVKKKVERDGKEVELTLWERERRFAQTVALNQLVYYREFGTTREVHRDTGEWETEEKKVPPEKRGSELLLFGINHTVLSPPLDQPTAIGYRLQSRRGTEPAVLGCRRSTARYCLHSGRHADQGHIRPATDVPIRSEQEQEPGGSR
jgi:capsid portal protein